MWGTESKDPVIMDLVRSFKASLSEAKVACDAYSKAMHKYQEALKRRKVIEKELIDNNVCTECYLTYEEKETHECPPF